MSRCGRPLDLANREACESLVSSSQLLLQDVISLLDNRIIRRDLTSRQYDGSLIINLPRMIHCKIELEMSAGDRTWFGRIMQDNEITQRKLSRISRKVQYPPCLTEHLLTMMQDFYARARQAAGQPEYVAWTLRHDNSTPPPPYQDLQDYDQRAATKTKTTVNIMKYHYECDNESNTMPLSLLEDEAFTGKVVLPDHRSQFRAVLFTQFPSLTPPLISVSDPSCGDLFNR